MAWCLSSKWRSYECYIGIMEEKMETTIVYWGDIGITEEKMETTIQCLGFRVGRRSAI